MPLTKDEECGHNADGSINFDYCQYCFEDGKFLQECTMEEMIDHCAQFVDEGMVEMMRGFFPMLKRWRTAGPNHQ